mmetsp:Transcript_15219/g.17106  ORF Transcript_15219/g.17106 Transcript_15219/m.17106 type:complete len:145 (-) Transcript_15219:124-558(-)
MITLWSLKYLIISTAKSLRLLTFFFLLLTNRPIFLKTNTSSERFFSCGCIVVTSLFLNFRDFSSSMKIATTCRSTSVSVGVGVGVGADATIDTTADPRAVADIDVDVEVNVDVDVDGGVDSDANGGTNTNTDAGAGVPSAAFSC